MCSLAALRPVDPPSVAAALEALVATSAPGGVVVLDLDRLHLLPGIDDALGRVLGAVHDALAGRAPWRRLADDVVAVLVPAVDDEADTERLARTLLTAVRQPGVAPPAGTPWTPVAGVAWSVPARADLLGAALEACWRARHGAADPVVTSGAPAPRLERRAAARPVPVPVVEAARPTVSAFDEFLVRISGQALGLDPTAFIAGLDDVLGQLLVVADADYAFVDVLGPDGRTVLNLAGATVAGHEDFVRSEPRLLEPDDPWRRMLVELEPVAVDDQFASHDGAHPANHPLGCAARSFLTVPFVVAGAMAGAMGVGCVDRAKPWSPADINGLRLTTGLVAAVLERDRLRRDQPT